MGLQRSVCLDVGIVRIWAGSPLVLQHGKLALMNAAFRQEPFDIAERIRLDIVAVPLVPGDVDTNHNQRTVPQRGQDQNKVRMCINVDDEIRRSESSLLHKIICDCEKCRSDVMTHGTSWIEMVGIRVMRADQFDFSADQPMLTVRALKLRPELIEDAVFEDGGLQTRAQHGRCHREPPMWQSRYLANLVPLPTDSCLQPPNNTKSH
jgi:hypothetical protein